jgi:hypothetical protein
LGRKLPAKNLGFVRRLAALYLAVGAGICQQEVKGMTKFPPSLGYGAAGE